MNYSTAVMLVNENIKAVLCIYEPDPVSGKPSPRTLFKTLDTTIKVGDLVIVPSNTRHQRTVVKVVEYDAEVDFDSNVQVDWIVGKVDQGMFERIGAEEAKAIEKIKAGEKLKRRREIAANMEALDIEGLKSLPIANMGAPVAIADNTVPGGQQNNAAATTAA